MLQASALNVFIHFVIISAITYIAQNPLSSAAEEYRIGIPSYNYEGLVGVEYLYPPEFAEDVEKIRKGENNDNNIT